MPQPDFKSLSQATQTLQILANEQRLHILCLLSSQGELSVAELLKEIDLSQSALSQHLAKLRAEGFVCARKEGLYVYYSIEREDVRQLLGLLHQVYCDNPEPPHLLMTALVDDTPQTVRSG